MSMDFNNSGSRTGDQVRDYFDERIDFQMLLSEAEDMAETSREMDFVAGLQDKFHDYGMKMFLSDRQLSWLRSIVGGE